MAVLRIKTEVYPMFIINAAAYALLDRMTTVLDMEAGEIVVQLVRKEAVKNEIAGKKENKSENEPENRSENESDEPFDKDLNASDDKLKKTFYDELVNQAHYFNQLKETKHITTQFIQRAFFSANPGMLSEIVEKKNDGD